MTPELTADQRQAVAEMILKVGESIAFGYVTNHCPECRDGEIAASNVATEALRALGFSYDEIRSMNACIKEEGKSRALEDKE